MKTIHVRVPASTSNLGPGYDCLGMALTLYADFTFTIADELRIEGCPEEFRNENNLVIQAFRKLYDKAGVAAPAVHLTVRSDVPVARGLGSSSTCLAAGFAAANAFLGDRYTKDELFQMSTAEEGHPDNAAPSVFGGLTASFMDEGRAETVSFTPDPEWRFVAVVPDYEVKTSEARKLVKKEIPLSAGIYSVSHAIAMVRALETGNEALLSAACTDVLHEPYRKALIPDYDDVRMTALEEGAATLFISGSGSTLIAVTKSQDVAERICEAVKLAHPTFGAHILRVSSEGTSVRA